MIANLLRGLAVVRSVWEGDLEIAALSHLDWGKPGVTSTDLATVAVDASVPNVEKLRAGLIDAIISVKAADYGVEAVRAAIAAAAEEDLPKFTEIGQCVITTANVDDPANEACIYQETPK